MTGQQNNREEHYELPFKEFDKPLKEVLMKNYLEPVAKWLVSDRQNTLLAIEAKSVWETGLSVLFLAEMDDLSQDNSISLENRVTTISNWLISKKGTDIIKNAQGQEITIYYWDKVTWDTSVVVRSLLTMLDKYPHKFSDADKSNIIQTTTQSCKWLYYMFLNWDKEVKYPFGPADLGQILTTILLLQAKFPNIYIDLCKEFKQESTTLDIATKIARKLLSIKTEKTNENHQLAINTNHNNTEIITFWWDDYFSTAEVVESLALFYVYCNNAEKTNSNLLPISDKNIKILIREALVNTCIYFEKEQVDGMWGNHIDTIKVLYSYVRVRDLIPKTNKDDEPIITPEVHTVFKALRWMCDEKQIFRDNPNDINSPKSFMHTMYLTVFYAHSLLEIYKRWDPVECSIAKIYDDVVWSSPTRTTPERAKRLALELDYIELNEKLEVVENKLSGATKLTKIISLMVVSFIVVFFVFGRWSKIVTTTFDINFQQQGSSIDIITLFVTLLVISASVVFGINKLFKKD